MQRLDAWRHCADLSPASLRFESRHDLDAWSGSKRSITWSGHKACLIKPVIGTAYN